MVARDQAAAGRPTRGQDRLERRISRAETRHARLHDLADAVALEDERQAADVILVRVGEHDQVDPPVPRWHPRVERDEQPVRVGTAVDEHSAAGRAGHEDRVALADVEHHDVGAPIRARGAGDQQDGDREGSEDAGEPEDPGAPAVKGRGCRLPLRGQVVGPHVRRAARCRHSRRPAPVRGPAARPRLPGAGQGPP